ncbi:MAG: hypothetical protein IPG34_16585 [Rhodocyclaceae bacterium]|nr:hypothetical protein [Rhodocyclaceae bacterium]
MLNPSDLDSAVIGEIGDSLTADGFGRVAANVFIRAHQDPNPYAKVSDLIAQEHDAQLAWMYAKSAREVPLSKTQSLIDSVWELDSLMTQYESFNEKYSALMERLMGPLVLTPEEAFAIRICLVFDYRMLVMKSPNLPAEFAERLKPLDDAHRSYAICTINWLKSQRRTARPSWKQPRSNTPRCG